jgi:3-oxocholest-4-en-26-oate---CoA ligase
MSWNLADVWEAVAARAGGEPSLMHGDTELSWAELDRRADALAHFLVARGAKPDDKIAIYSYSRPEYIVALFAAFKARLVPVNVNYRYRQEELSYLFENSDSVAVVFEGAFADNIAPLRARLPKLTTYVQLDDGSPLAPWAASYDDIVSAKADTYRTERSGDDLLFIYTGGTTGMPKGVMWRQEDVWFTLGGGGDPIGGEGKPSSLAEHGDNVERGLFRMRLLPASPLMHGTGLLTAISALMHGGSIVTLTGQKFDAHELWSAVERKSVNVLAIVGDVFARPMADALDEKRYDLSSLRMIISSGVMFSPEIKKRLLAHHDGMMIVDSLGASEATGIGVSITSAGSASEPAKFKIGSRVKVFTDDEREVLPGSGERGRVGRAGPIPVGYYKDPEKSARTFPVIGGVRYSMPGDYATVAEDGTIVLLGRGSQCINTGGEKVFPEEVEEVLKRHPRVRDAAVVGLPDEKWGQAVTAVVEIQGTGAIDEDEIRALVRNSLAGYKVPKRVFAVPTLGRSPSGKMDYKAVTEAARRMAGGG